MSCYLSSSCFRNVKLSSAIEACGSMSNLNVEISAPHPHESIDDLKKILKKYRDQNYNFTFHNYFPAPKKSFVLNIASSEKDTIQACQKMLKDVLTLSFYANSNIYGIHAGYLSKATPQSDGNFQFEEKTYGYEKSLERATNFVNAANKDFEKKNVHLLIENLFPSLSRRSSLFCDLKEISEFMQLVPKSVGLLLDLGHLNISSNLLKFDREKFINKYLEFFGDRLSEVHISENNGLKDEHLALKKGSWQLEAIKKIKEIKPTLSEKRIYCLEARNSNSQDLKNSLNQINEIIN